MGQETFLAPPLRATLSVARTDVGGIAVVYNLWRFAIHQTPGANQMSWGKIRLGEVNLAEGRKP